MEDGSQRGPIIPQRLPIAHLLRGRQRGPVVTYAAATIPRLPIPGSDVEVPTGRRGEQQASSEQSPIGRRGDRAPADWRNAIGYRPENLGGGKC